MDRIMNACRLFQVANITHILAHAPAEVFARGHIRVSDGDKAHMANNLSLS